MIIALAASYPDVAFEFSAINGQVALVAGLGGDLPAAIQLDVRNGLITQIFVFLNPDKLSGLYGEHDLFAHSPATPRVASPETERG